MNEELAIIVPAHKIRFLAQALGSLASQTSNNFKVYIFDDCSSEPIRSVAETVFSDARNDFAYFRFDQNLGGTNLTKHFDRCVNSTKETWVWLFADDDIMDESCVASFWKTVRDTKSGFDVYCFNSSEIDAEDRVVALHPSLPEWESWKQFAYFLFRGSRTVPQQAMIFSRAAFQKFGGFVEFPLGWTSDQATLMALAGEKGIKLISGPKVRFRRSGENISSTENPKFSSQKLRAAIQFMRWVIKRFDDAPVENFELSNDLLRRSAFEWFREHLAALHVWYNLSECTLASRFVKETWRESYGKTLAYMLRLNARLLLENVRFRLFSTRQ